MIQGRGALIAYRGTGPVIAASANAADLFGCDPIGKTPGEVLDKEGLHAVRNSAALPLAATRSVFSGRVGNIDLHAFVEADFTVVEAEPATSERLPDAYNIERDVALIAGETDAEVQSSLVRTLSGFDVVEDLPDSEPPLGVLPGHGLLILDDLSRAPVDVLGDVPPLARSGLRQPDEAVLKPLVDEGIRAVTIVPARQRTLVLKHGRPRLPNHRSRLVLLHLARLL